MPSYLVMWAHLVALVVFIGSHVFLGLVVRPLAAGTPEHADLLRRIGRRAKTFAWSGLVLLLITGFFNLLNEGGSARIESAWGGVLMLKLLLVFALIGLSVVHDFILDPYGPGAERGPAARVAARARTAARVQSGIIVLSVVVLLVAAYLAKT
ncbi:MAG: CopD family protein [Nitrospirota bacterium]